MRRLAPDGNAVTVVWPTYASGKPEDWRYRTVIYDLSGRRGPITVPLDVGPCPPCWSPDGKRLALVEPTGDLTLWDGATGGLIGRAAAGFGNGSSSPAFLPAGDGVIGVCGDAGLTPRPFDLVVWKPATSQLDRRSIPKQGARPGGKIAVAADGRSLADTSGSRARLWDLATLERRFLLVGHSEQVMDLAFAPDGRTLATASNDKTVRLWSVNGGQELLVWMAIPVRSAPLPFRRIAGSWPPAPTGPTAGSR